MVNGFIISNVKRTNRNLLITNTVLILFVVSTLLLSWRYFYNVINGPFEVSNNKLLSISDLSQELEYYITVKGYEVIYSGLSYVEKSQDGSENSSIKYDYLLLKVDSKMLVVQTRPTTDQTLVYSGALLKMPDEIDGQLIEIAKKQGISPDEYRQKFLPYILDTVDFKADGYILLSLIILCFILSTVNLTKFFIRVMNNRFHPIHRALSYYGNSDLLEKEINEEIKNNVKAYSDKVIITKSWLFIKTLYKLKVANINDIVWIHKDSFSINGILIPERGIHIYLKNGKNTMRR